MAITSRSSCTHVNSKCIWRSNGQIPNLQHSRCTFNLLLNIHSFGRSSPGSYLLNCKPFLLVMKICRLIIQKHGGDFFFCGAFKKHSLFVINSRTVQRRRDCQCLWSDHSNIHPLHTYLWAVIEKQLTSEEPPKMKFTKVLSFSGFCHSWQSSENFLATPDIEPSSPCTRCETSNYIPSKVPQRLTTSRETEGERLHLTNSYLYGNVKSGRTRS